MHRRVVSTHKQEERGAVVSTIRAMNQETWAEYVRRVTRSMSQTEIAEKTGVAQTAIGRWLRGDTGAPRAESVVAFARAVNKPAIEALIAAGYLEPSDATGAAAVQSSIRDFTTDELLAEIRRRTIAGTG